MKGIKIFLKEKKTKSVITLVNDIEVFLKKEKRKKGENDRELYKKFQEYEKQRQVE